MKCSMCGEEIFRCADARCERGGWWSRGQPKFNGDGRHEHPLFGGLDFAPHVPE